MEFNQDPRQYLAGDVWDTIEDVKQLAQIPEPTIANAQIKVTRLPFWNDYYILPIYAAYLFDNGGMDLIGRFEKPDFLDGVDMQRDGISVHCGIIGVHRTFQHVVHPIDLDVEKYFYNTHNFDFADRRAVVVGAPFQTLIPMEMKVCNVLATMQDTVTPKQIEWLKVHAPDRIMFVNLPDLDEEAIVREMPGCNISVTKVKLDYQLTQRVIKDLAEFVAKQED